ncbi:protealysin inhibitor emfourin [Quadrisphaera sp. KR29]|uniref:protealysin inhibitor emfourin n=1 Tax=Quadrisphaera sp. KR29 TaxID=3461391 RepID=UPI0040450907
MRVVVERSGGFAGLVRRGEADSSQLDEATARQLRALVADAEGAGAAAPAGRRDGFCYEVTLEDPDDDGGDGDGGDGAAASGAPGLRRVVLREGSLPVGARQLLEGLLR